MLKITRGLEQFRRTPIYAAAVVASLSIGIAAACGAFAIVKRALVDPLPYPDADRLVTIRTVVNGRPSLGSSYLVGQELRVGPLFAIISGDWGRTVTYEAPGASERLSAGVATPEYFDVLGIRPAYGSTFTAGAADEVVVSWSFFERVLSADPSAIGRQLSIDSLQRRVVGVMPKDFAAPFLSEAVMWLPLDTRPLLQEQLRGRRSVILQARLADGVSVDDARAWLSVFSEQQRRQHPDIFGRQHWVIDRLQDVQVEPSRTLLIATAVAAGLLMLIVLTNVAGLAAARAGELRRADAIRLALGASRGRLFRERLIESLVLTAAGTGIGLWLASLFIAWTSRSAAQYQLLLEDVPAAAMDPHVFLFGAMLGAAAGVVASVVPQQAARSVGVDELLGSGRGFSGPRLARTRAALVVAQVAVSVVLLVAAGLLVRSVRSLMTTPLGFSSSQVATVDVMLPAARYQTEVQQHQLESAVLERLRSTGRIEAASAAVSMPPRFAPVVPYSVTGQPASDDRSAVIFSVAPGFFSFLRLPLLAGREFDHTDGPQSAPALVVNQMMARALRPDGNALGIRVRFGQGRLAVEPTIVGIVPDVQQNGLAQEIRPTMYMTTRQLPASQRVFAVRTSEPLSAIAADLRAAVHAVDPLLAVSAPLTLDRLLDSQIAQQRFIMSVLTAFAGVAAALCALGLYAVVAMTAQGRRREFAVRMALGAQYGHVGWLVMRQSVVLGGIGAAIGLAGSFSVTGLLASMLHGIERTDPGTLAAVLLAIVVLAIAASLMPALKAARIDPVTVLKAD